MMDSAFRVVLGCGPIPAAVLDASDRVAEVNDAFARWLGYEAAELRGIPGAELTAGEALAAGPALLAACHGGAPSPFPFRRRNGSTARAAVSAWSVGGEPADVVMLARPLGEALGNDLTAAIAHELRNPLAAVGGALQVIHDRMSVTGPDREVLADIVHRLRAFDVLIEDLVHLAEPPQPDMQPQSMVTLLAGAAASVPAGMSLEGDDVAVRGDRVLLMRAMRALLASVTNGDPAVAAEIRTEGDTCVVDVRGDGDDARALLDGGDRMLRRHAVGLTLACRILATHGGEVEVANARARGFALSVRIPTGAGGAASAGGSPQHSS